MKREDAVPYVSFRIGPEGKEHSPDEPIPYHARLVGWQCGFEPLFVAVWDSEWPWSFKFSDAESVAIEFLVKRQWFAGQPREANYIF